MMEQLRPGGTLAVQTPMNYDEPIHQIIGRLTSSGKWAGRFSQLRIFYNLRPEAYCDLLAETAVDYSLWETTYVHRLGSHEDILEWYRGTGLRPYLSAVSYTHLSVVIVLDDLFAVAEEQGNAPDTRQCDNRVDDAANSRGSSTEGPRHYVELK